jgi:hypothetical protein
MGDPNVAEPGLGHPPGQLLAERAEADVEQTDQRVAEFDLGFG